MGFSSIRLPSAVRHCTHGDGAAKMLEEEVTPHRITRLNITMKKITFALMAFTLTGQLLAQNPSRRPVDDDGDGILNSDDVCPGHDDTVDEDGDGVPDGCDDFPEQVPIKQDQCQDSMLLPFAEDFEQMDATGFGRSRSAGRPSLLKNPPGILPAAYVLSW